MIAALADALLGPLLGLLSIIGVGLGAWLAGQRKGRKQTEIEHEIDRHNEYIATRKRIEAAVAAADSADARERMRNRDPRKP